MKYLYPIRVDANNYHFGKTDVDEVNIEPLCEHEHLSPTQASDCFRETLLKNKPVLSDIEPRKCQFSKCANTTDKLITYDYDFSFAVCKEHESKVSIRKICGFGFPLLLHEK